MLLSEERLEARVEVGLQEGEKRTLGAVMRLSRSSISSRLPAIGLHRWLLANSCTIHGGMTVGLVCYVSTKQSKVLWK